MNKLNNLSSVKYKLKKIVAIIIIFCAMLVSSKIQLYPHIPLKGLFTVLKIDDIGFAHTLLHSKWIENMYQYGAGKPHREIEVRNRKKWKTEDKGDAVANLVRKFWFRRSENHQLLPTQFGCLANIPNNKLGKIFGQLINVVYQGVPQESQNLLIDTLVPYGQNFEQYRQELTILWRELIDQEYVLKHDKKFDSVRQANLQLQGEIARLQLQEKFNMTELNQQIVQASKVCKQSKDLIFKNEKKKIESKFDKRGYQKAFKEAKQRIFLGLEEELDEYHSIKTTVRKLQATVAKKAKQKRDFIKKELLLPIAKSLKLCKAGNVYMPRITEGILWALFFHKIDALSSQEEKVQVINDCINCIDTEFRNNVTLDTLYSIQEVESFEKKIKKLKVDKQAEEIFINYDLALHVLITKLVGSFPPKISEGNFGYEYKKGKISKTRHNCYETTMHDFFSLLWYNPKIKGYDDSLFSWDVLQNGQGFKRFREALKFFYLADEKNTRAKEYTINRGTSLLVLKDLQKISAQEVRDLSISEIPISFIKRSVMKQEFMNIVSGIPGVSYCSQSRDEEKDFELDTNVKNFIQLCNYFYGVGACPEPSRRIDNLEDLGKAISTEAREISFGKQSNKDTPNKIKVSVYDKKNRTRFKMIVNIKPDHAFITVPARDQVASKILKDAIAEKFLGKLDDSKCLAFFTLLSSEALFTKKKMPWGLPVSNLVYYTLGMQGNQIKLAIIKDVFKAMPQHYNKWKGMICNLLETYPLDDYHLGGGLKKILVNKSYSYWSDFIIQALEKGYEEIALAVARNERFDVSESGAGEALKAFLEKGYKDIALSIVNNKKFDAGRYAVGSGLKVALEKGYQDIALLIINNEKFDPSCGIAEALKVALEKENREVFLSIVNHKKFDASRPGIDDALKVALKKGYKEIALLIISSKKFKISEYSIGEILGFAHESGCYDISHKILDDYRFKYWEKVFKLSVEKEWESLVLEVISHKRFDISGYWVCDTLNKALEKGYRAVVLAAVNKKEFYPRGYSSSQYKVIEILKRSLEKEYKNIVSVIVNHENFDMSDSKIIDIFKGILKKEWHHIALSIVNNDKFDLSQCKADVFKLLFEKGYHDIALIILNNEKFYSGRSSYSYYSYSHAGRQAEEVFNFILETLPSFSTSELRDPEKENIALAILNHEKFRVSEYGLVDALKVAIKRGYKNIALKIVDKDNFEGDGYGYKLIDALKLAFELQYEPIADKILALSRFDRWGQILKFVLEKRWKEIALSIVNHERFKTNDWYMGDALCLAKNLGYTDIATKILDDSDFKYWGNALELSLKEKWFGMALDLVKHERFDAKGIIKGLKLALGLKQREIALAIVSNKEYDACRGAEVLKVAIENGYEKVALSIANNKDFEASGTQEALKFALAGEYREIALAIINNSKFSISGDDAGACLVLALQNKWEDISAKILGSDFSKWGEAVKFALEKEELGIALWIMDQEKFKASNSSIGEAFSIAKHKHFEEVVKKILQDSEFKSWGAALRFAIQKEWKHIAEDILKHEKFDASSCYVDDALICALEKGYIVIALSIVQDEKFNIGGYKTKDILKVALRQAQGRPLENKHKDIALEIVNSEKFYTCDYQVREILIFLLEQKYKDMALEIVNHEKFVSGKYLAEEVIDIAQKKGYFNIVAKILEHPQFECWKKVLELALKKGWQEIAIKVVSNERFDMDKIWFNGFVEKALKKGFNEVAIMLVKHKKFDASEYQIRDILKLSLEKNCIEIATILVESKKFDADTYGMKDVFKLAFEKKHKKIAFAFLKSPRFNVEDIYGMDKIFKKALEEGDTDIALGIINNKNFDADKYSVKDILSYAQEFLQKNTENSKELQEVIDLIESKRSKN